MAKPNPPKRTPAQEAAYLAAEAKNEEETGIAAREVPAADVVLDIHKGKHNTKDNLDKKGD